MSGEVVDVYWGVCVGLAESADGGLKDFVSLYLGWWVIRFYFEFDVFDVAVWVGEFDVFDVVGDVAVLGVFVNVVDEGVSCVGVP